MKTNEAVKAQILANKQADRNTYEGLTTDEIADYNRRMMFGESDEAFPGNEEWSRIVD